MAGPGGSPDNRIVPQVAGVNADHAAGLLGTAELCLGATTTAPSNVFPEGAMIQSSPEAGSVTPRLSRIAIIVSSGPGSTRLPSPWAVEKSPIPAGCTDG